MTTTPTSSSLPAKHPEVAADRAVWPPRPPDPDHPPDRSLSGQLRLRHRLEDRATRTMRCFPMGSCRMIALAILGCASTTGSDCSPCSQHQGVQHRHHTACPDSALTDLWVIGREVTRLDPPQTFARLPCSSRRRPRRAYLKAMSADILLTPHARAGSVVTHEPDPDLRFYFVAGAGFEPATSGL
jgi:hypothetical protein